MTLKCTCTWNALYNGIYCYKAVYPLKYNTKHTMLYDQVLILGDYKQLLHINYSRIT